jgi:DNA-binding MarR family transcriptional regulator
MATRIDGRTRDDRVVPRAGGQTALTSIGAAAIDAGERLPDDETVGLARLIYAVRRERDESFGGELFSEPAWDILLHLYVAGTEASPVSVSSACGGAAAPATTALRKLRQLEEQSWIVRAGDPADARRSYVRLSPTAEKKMRELLRGACRRLDERS